MFYYPTNFKYLIAKKHLQFIHNSVYYYQIGDRKLEYLRSWQKQTANDC